ncbi:MAG: protein-ADP-ribose hydrolase [Lachnospiraceae bacterium]|nr:protein-ADP-ribose hydrolase [Lachnospiraceae bacterium]
MKKNIAQEERLDYLIEEFKADSDEYKDLKTPADTEGKRRVLRSLMNIRMPRSMSEDVLKVQDEYLKERISENGIVTLADIPVTKDNLSIWQGDITRLKVDAIVNAANSQMLGCFVPMHTCIDNCIHTFAGVQLRAECNRQMNQLRIKYGRNYEQPTAVPMLTDGFNLPAKKVVHIVGPIVSFSLTPALEKDLADCYTNTLEMCAENDLKSVAFCCISTGVFHFPNKRAAEIAVKTVTDWMTEHPGKMERVIFNVFQGGLMYEKLDKLRAEVKRWEQKIEDDKAKLRIAQEKLEKAENEQILADVGALKLKPEQLAEFLKLATSGKLGAAGSGNAFVEKSDRSAYATDDETENEDETEDFEDEEN